MKWIKKGHIFSPDGRYSWAKQYAFPATPYAVRQGVIRIYLGFCNENTVGRIGFVEVDADNPANILNVTDAPVLDIGVPGAFDENGVVPTSIVAVEDKLYLYYVGFQQGQKVRYFQFQGLAISDDGGLSFRRFSQTPIIERSNAELLNRTSAFVMREDGIFKMWYVGGSEWTTVNDKTLPIYPIKYLESDDGKNWGPEGRLCLDFQNEDEHALGRPWVFKDEGRYKMFYSVRTRSLGYRIGYAESPDGINWQRKDKSMNLDVSDSGWDSEMIAYASVYRHGERTYLFYNGNNCGQTGFGYAELARD